MSVYKTILYSQY